MARTATELFELNPILSLAYSFSNTYAYKYTYVYNIVYMLTT